MLYRILGPLWTAGPIATQLGRRRREQLIVGALLLSAGRPVSTNDLVDLLWDSSPPATAREQVQNCTSRLSRAIKNAGAPPIRRATNSYQIDVDANQLDALAFQQGVQDGRARLQQGNFAEATFALRKALTLWRGDVLGAIPLGRLEALTVPLVELRAVGLELLFESELADGHASEILAELRAAVRNNPLRERYVSQLMRTLAATGRTTEALDLFQHTRTQLATEYGIDPGEELQEIQMGILNGQSYKVRDPYRHNLQAENRRMDRSDLPRYQIADALRRLNAAKSDLENLLNAYVLRADATRSQIVA